MTKRFTVLHVEDDGQARRNFIDEVLPPDKFPFDIIHPNPVEKILNNEQLEGEIKLILGRRDIDFIVIDLALSSEQHTVLDEWFTKRNFPKERPGSMGGGIGLADGLIKRMKYPAAKISFLTRHRPNTSFRDLNALTDTWWGYPVTAHYKDSEEELSDLQKEIFTACAYAPEEENAPQSPLHTAKGFLPFVICASDSEDFRRKVEGAIHLYNGEQPSGENAGREIIDTKEKGSKGFEEAFESFVRHCDQFHCFVVIDFTIGLAQNQVVEEACKTGNFEGVLGDLPGIQTLKRIRDEIQARSISEKTTTIAVSRSGHHPRLVRWCMKDLRVNFVMAESDFTLNFISAIELFRDLHH